MSFTKYSLISGRRNGEFWCETPRGHWKPANALKLSRRRGVDPTTVELEHCVGDLSGKGRSGHDGRWENDGRGNLVKVAAWSEYGQERSMKAIDPPGRPGDRVDDAALRKAWRDSGRAARQAARDLADMAPGHANRATVETRLAEAREARALFEEEAGRRGIELAPKRGLAQESEAER